MALHVPLDPALKQWATPRQAEYLTAYNEHGSLRAAARAMGVVESAVQQSLDCLKKKAAQKGFAPEHDMTHTAPDPFVVRGVSTYYDRDGEVRGQWVKTKLDDERAELARRAAMEALATELPRVLPFERPDACNADLCNWYTITDAHVGMLSWAKETGADWDLSIAEKTLVGCFESMMLRSPAAGLGVVYQGGDFLHYDGLEAVTPTNRHQLDADGRFSKMVAVGIRIVRRMVEIALMRHDRVLLILAEGNHDIASSVWLRHMFAAVYENNSRVTVDTSELPYYVHQHGSVMLCAHHGHMKKKEGLPLVFAARFPEIWGQTRKRYCHTGHQHHIDEKEHSGMVVVQHPTLAAPDAHSARFGWLSERAAQAITYHTSYGEVGRVMVTPEMIAA